MRGYEEMEKCSFVRKLGLESGDVLDRLDQLWAIYIHRSAQYHVGGLFVCLLSRI